MLMSLVFWHRQWLADDVPVAEKFWLKFTDTEWHFPDNVSATAELLVSFNFSFLHMFVI